MTYPAFAALLADPDLTTTRMRAFVAMQPHLDFATARPVKVEAVATLARISTGSAADAINWLIQRGYLVVRRQDGRGVRDVTLAYALPVVAAR